MLALNKDSDMVRIKIAWIDAQTDTHHEEEFDVPEEVRAFIEGLVDRIDDLEKEMPAFSLN